MVHGLRSTVSLSPSPSSRHQGIAMRLGAQLDRHFADGPCRVFGAPMDLRLSDEDVVQPDLLVVCDTGRIRPTHIEGAPSLTVEIRALRVFVPTSR